MYVRYIINVVRNEFKELTRFGHNSFVHLSGFCANIPRILFRQSLATVQRPVLYTRSTTDSAVGRLCASSTQYKHYLAVNVTGQERNA